MATFADIPKKRALAIGIFLLAVLTFLPALWNDFVSLDDSLYVYQNTLVQGGMSWPGIIRAFAGPECNFYHPLTMLSLMFDYQLWGLNPEGYHLTNILLHAASASLLFLVLTQMTGAAWRSAFVAIVFALHPLRVESVAWIAERKDGLSVLCFMLTLLAYGWYARRPPAIGRYLIVLLIFALGLLCKASLVTLPGVLLLLDYWPLGRTRTAGFPRLLAEKLPFLALAIIAGFAAIAAEKANVLPYETYPLFLRWENAVLSSVIYLGQTIFPFGLSPFYPFAPATFTPWKVAAVLAFLLGLTVVTIARRQTQPYLTVGWLWYLGTLAPMLGIVQIGAFAHADRFTYLPQIGVLIMLAWGVSDLTCWWRTRTVILSLTSASVVLACIAITVRQIHFWSESETLFRHALAVTTDNGAAEESLGIALAENLHHGRVTSAPLTPARKAEALVHLRRAVLLLPSHADTHLNLGLALARTPARTEAIKELQTALQTMSFDAPGQFWLGLLLAETGDTAAALPHLVEAVRLDPRNLVARNNLASILRRSGRDDEAIEQYRIALRQNPRFVDGHNNLGIALYQRGQKAEAIREFQEALRCDPANPEARRNLQAVQQGGD